MIEPVTEIARIGEDFGRWDELLALILSSFAYMDNIIDPPSSAHRLTLASLARKARDEIAFAAIENGRITGCVFLRTEPDFLYIGKLAIAPADQGKGIGRRLLAVAEEIAREKACPRYGSKPASNSPTITRPSQDGALPGRRKIPIRALPAPPRSKCRNGWRKISCGPAERGSAGGGRRRRCGC